MRIAQGYAVDRKYVEGVPPEVAEGAYAISPSPALGSSSYKRAAAILGTDDVSTYAAQTYDHASLAILAVAKAGEASGTAIKENLRKISQGSGEQVDNAVDGLKLLAAGKEINYTGASGPCDFNEIGDILDCQFKYEQVEKGKLKILRVA
jgi:branched-chain amino acid transport system substrate-binding protein